MNIYQPLADYELAKILLIHAHAALEAEGSTIRKPEHRFCADGVANAKHLLNAGIGASFSALRTLRAAMELSPDDLFYAIRRDHGSDVYLNEESPLVSALISICATMQGVSHRDCAKAIADEHDEMRAGVHL